MRPLGGLGFVVVCVVFMVAATVDGFRSMSETVEEPLGRYARTLGPGDCFDTHSWVFGVNRRVEEVDCAGPHDGEMLGLWWTDAGPAGDYPGRDSLTAAVGRQCRSQAHLYTGWEEHPGVEVVHGAPSEAAWAAGARNGGCYFLAKNGKVSGSLRKGAASEAV